MQKLTPLLVLLIIAFISCNQEERLLDHQVNSTIDEVTSESSIHNSILKSSWWQEMPSFTKELHTIELSTSPHLVTYEEIEEMRAAKVRLMRASISNSRAKCISPGYPTPNPEGNVTLTTQADVDAFGAIGCNEISGFLSINDTIPGSPICDLSPLMKLKKVGSYLIISASCVTDLHGFHKLKSVGELGPFGFIAIRGENVTNIDALKKIKTITGSINFTSNLNLVSIGKAFKKITTIESGKTTAPIASGYVISLYNNPVLSDVGKLKKLTTIEGSFLFRDNDALTDLDGFRDLTSIGRFIAIEDNDVLQNVNKLSIISSISSGIIVQNNPSLTDCCGLYSLVCSNPPLCDIPGAAEGYVILNNGAGCTDIDIITNGPC